MVKCYDCKGKGYQLFMDQESTCKPCQGSGEMVVCSQFSYAPGAVVAFRNQKCHNCGVRQNDHNAAEVTA